MEEKLNKEASWISENITLYRGFTTKKNDEDKEVFDRYNDKFYKNNQEIEDLEDDTIFTEEKFDSLIKAEVSKFINQSFDNIVVLAGAGASVTNNIFEKDEETGINISGVTVAKIAEEVYSKLSKNKYKFKEIKKSVKVLSLEKLIERVHYQYQITDAEFNLEDLISLIIRYESFDKSDEIANTKKAIFDIIIKATSYEFDEKIFRHIKFLNSLISLTKSENKLNIVTTNYDTLIEDAADKINFTVFDGFSFSQIPKFNSEMFDWNITKNVPNVKTHQNIYMKNVINLLKIHGSLTWEFSKTDENILRKNKKNVIEPIMVFPSSDKYAQSYQEPYFELFAKFQELLKRPNTLFITTGFSFSDNHISKMILSAIQSNDGLATLVTDFSIDSKAENWTKMVKKMENYYRIAFLKSSLNTNLDVFLRGGFDDN